MGEPEDEILAERFGRVGRGAKLAAGLLGDDVSEFDRDVPLRLGLAMERIRAVLAELPRSGPAQLVDAGPDRVTVRRRTGGGTGNLNPVEVTVVATRRGEHSTAVHVRAVAKEGLIKQRAARRTAGRIAALLDDAR
ncbi:hypothetical protein ACQP1P_27205 [Dactylosporangium sp. CA-052675]|uniref:hypothetical protein n=1 Tax=Dactylosporangium sp. CA-052675 TaxID=3239927 RepID=UPI003D932A8F